MIFDIICNKNETDLFVTLFDISLILDIVNAVNNITESPVYDTAQVVMTCTVCLKKTL